MADDLETLVRLSTGIGGELLSAALSGEKSILAEFLRASHHIANANRDNWHFQILQKSPIGERLLADETSEAFRALGLHPNRSRHLYSGFLGKAEFELGRRNGRDDVDSSKKLLEGAREHLEMSLSFADGEDLLRASRFHCGMLGVINLLPRDGGKAGLSAAVHYFERAEANGDQSAEHYRYLGQAYLELADYTKDLQETEAALGALTSAREQLPDDAEVVSLYAQACYRTAIGRIREVTSLDSEPAGEHGDNEDPLGEADDLLRESIGLYEDVRFHPPDNYTVSAILVRLGTAYRYRWWSSRDLSSVTKAVALFRQVASEQPGAAHQLAHSLLILANHGVGNEKSLLQEARSAIATVPIDSRGSENWVLDGRVALAIAIESSDAPELERAIGIFRRLQASEESEVARHLGTAVGTRGLWNQLVNDLVEAERLLRNRRVQETDGRPGLYPRICRELALQVAANDQGKALGLLDQSTRSLTRTLGKRADPELLSMIAGSYFHRYHISRSTKDLEAARTKFEEALAAGSSGDEFFGLIGDCTLQCAKAEKELEIREELLSASLEYLRRSTDFGSQPFVHDSKVGEAALRLGRVQRDPVLLKEAVGRLEKSIAQGGSSPEAFGLLGDAHYFLARFETTVDHLEEALVQKELARSNREPSREHFSVVGKIHDLLFQELGEQSHLNAAVEFMAKAARADPSWPWPICQLADLIDRRGAVDVEPGLLGGLDSVRPALETGESGYLWKQGAAMVVQWSDLAIRTIGGKSGVWTVNDPLGLLDQAFVFKPALRGRPRVLDEEVKNLERVRQIVAEEKIEGVEIPVVIGILRRNNESVLAMRRSLAPTLASVLPRLSTASMNEVCQNALEVLALFEARIPCIQSETNAARFRNHLSDLGEALFDNRSELLGAVARYGPLLERLPCVGKRDAHAENWLLARDGRLTVLDIEAPYPRYFLEEAAQLIEDCLFMYREDPIQGLSPRVKLAKYFLSAFEQFSNRQLSLGEEEIASAYVFFASLQALHGLKFAREKAAVALTVSGAGLWVGRQDKAKRLLVSLAALVEPFDLQLAHQLKAASLLPEAY